MRTRTKRTLRPHRGFLTYGPTLDSLSSRDREEPDQEDPDEDVVEIHNHYPSDPGEFEVGREDIVPNDRARHDEEEEGEEVGRFPAGHYASYDSNGELVIRAGEPRQETDLYDMDTGDRRRGARDSKGLPVPHTLAEMNKFMARHYGRGGRRSQPVR